MVAPEQEPNSWSEGITFMMCLCAHSDPNNGKTAICINIQGAGKKKKANDKNICYLLISAFKTKIIIHRIHFTYITLYSGLYNKTGWKYLDVVKKHYIRLTQRSATERHTRRSK